MQALHPRRSGQGCSPTDAAVAERDSLRVPHNGPAFSHCSPSYNAPTGYWCAHHVHTEAIPPLSMHVHAVRALATRSTPSLIECVLRERERERERELCLPLPQADHVDPVVVHSSVPLPCRRDDTDSTRPYAAACRGEANEWLLPRLRLQARVSASIGRVPVAFQALTVAAATKVHPERCSRNPASSVPSPQRRGTWCHPTCDTAPSSQRLLHGMTWK